MRHLFTDHRSIKQIGGWRAYLRQVIWSVRQWLRGAA